MSARNLETPIESKSNSETTSDDIVFKEACLAILPRARNVLSLEQFNEIAAYASEMLKLKITLKSNP